MDRNRLAGAVGDECHPVRSWNKLPQAAQITGNFFAPVFAMAGALATLEAISLGVVKTDFSGATNPDIAPVVEMVVGGAND